MPLNVACVCVFEGDIPFDDFRPFVESSCRLFPAISSEWCLRSLNIGLPTLGIRPKFRNPQSHTRGDLKHGSDAELKAVAGKTLGKVMDRQRPLWDLTLVHGLKRNRTGLIVRLHHCLADGIAGVGIMSALMDTCPTPAPTAQDERRRAPRSTAA